MFYAKALDVDFSQSATIGRQYLYLSESDLKKAMREFGYAPDEETIHSIFNKNNGYAEEFLRFLGAKDVHSFDISDYEGATYLHDMNKGLPERFKEKYTMVLDGGSLEHIFNLPTAMKNFMEMAQVGGHYIGLTLGNNFMGHGFYQPSHELYFNVFTRANGFELVDVIASEDRRTSKWFAIKNPASARRRATLTNTVPVFLFVVAKRVKKTAIFEPMPQQSSVLPVRRDEDVLGDAAQTDLAQPDTERLSLLASIARHIPEPLKSTIRRMLRYNYLMRRLLGYQYGFNPRFYQPIKPTERAQELKKTLGQKRN